MTNLDVDIRLSRAEFSLEVRDTFALNGITALFGPNGSGKTTLLRSIAGLERAGEIVVCFGGETWADRSVTVPPHRRPLAMVFQQPVLFEHLSVQGNLEFADKRAGTRATDISLAEIVSSFDLTPLLGRSATVLSGGERQRVAMARALLSRPRLLLMDEPLAALDIARRAEALSYIEQIPERFGVPILYVTHSIDEVVRLASDIVLMVDGAIVAKGPVQDVLARLDLPPLTGRFEGGAVLSGTVTGQDQVLKLTRIALGSGLEMSVPELPLEMDMQVRLRIRARDVAIATAKPQQISMQNCLPCFIDEIVEEAETAFAELRLKVAGQFLRSRITRKSLQELGLKKDQEAFALIKSVALDRRMLASKRRSNH